MRRVGWLCVVLGLALALLYPVYAGLETRIRDQRWIDHQRAYGDGERLLRMLGSGERPAGIIVDWRPGVLGGLGVAAFGVLILAIRPPRRD